jgi:HEPN domain-containing protein
MWIDPEMARRVKDGQITEEFVLDRAQVLIHPNKIKPEIRLNDEVKASILANLKNKDRKPGDLINESDLLDAIHRIELTDNDDPNCGHLTMILFKGRWVIHFDFRVNKPKAKERYGAAKEFYHGAKLCYENKLWRPFIDNLFSSAELLATSQLMVLSLPKTKSNKPRHNSILSEYNLFINTGNAKQQHKEVFNKLSGLRNSGRYLNQDFKLRQYEAEEMLKTVADISTYTEKVIT